MAHNIHGIITSFRYEGPLPNIILVGNYHFIPFDNTYGPNYSESTLDPYDEFTTGTRKILKELSFIGKCAYIETAYHGGCGAQISEAWHNGEKIIGPLISFDGSVNPKIPSDVIKVKDSINETLKTIDVYKHQDNDEFDSIRLGWYRSNSEIIEEFKLNLTKNK